MLFLTAVSAKSILPFLGKHLLKNCILNINEKGVNPNFDIPKMFIWDIFSGQGLKINYLSGCISLNPMYKIGLNYLFGKKDNKEFISSETATEPLFYL